MTILDFNKDLLRSKIIEGGIVLVDCWANWCSACKDFAPVFERVANRFPNHTFGKLNTQTEIELSEILEIAHIPSLLLYRGGYLLFRQPGYFDEEKLVDIVKQAESLDMNKVRAQMDEEFKNATNQDKSSNQDK
jgi:thioredoxin 1